MEAKNNIKQLVKPAEPAATMETIKNISVNSCNVSTVEGTNNKAKEINAPYGFILVSYESKVELLTHASIYDDSHYIRYVSKLYNNYSVTTARHQAAFEADNRYNRFSDITIYLEDKTAQKLFNAAITNAAAFEQMEHIIINQFKLEFETMELIQQTKTLLNGAENLEEKTRLINKLLTFLNFELELKKVNDEVLKTVDRQTATYEAHNIRFEVVRTWNKNGSIKNIKIQKIETSYKSLLAE